MAVLLQFLVVLVAFGCRWIFLRGLHLRGKPSDELQSKNLNYVGIARAPGPDFHVLRESWHCRLMVGLGLYSRTSDIAGLCIATDAPFDMAALAPGLEKLFALRVSSMHAAGERIWVRLKSRADSEAAVALLREIKPLLPKTGSSQRAKSAHALIALNPGLMVLGGLGFLTTIPDDIRIIDPWAMFVAGMLAAPFVVTAWILLLCSIFGRSSWGRWVVGEFLLVGSLGLFFFTPILLRDLNVALPQPEPELVRRAIVNIGCQLTCDPSHPVWRYLGRRSQSRAGNIYVGDICSREHRSAFIAWQKKTRSSCERDSDPDLSLLIIVDYPERSEPMRFSPSDLVFDAAARRTPMLVAENPGAFGFVWVNEAQIAPDLAP